MESSIATFSPTREWTGNPEPSLRMIAEAGFKFVHWGHHWCDDFMYSGSEVRQIRRWLKTYGLSLRDMHASAGVEKSYLSKRGWVRLAGVELIKNRLRMTADLGGSAIVLHLSLPGEGVQGDDAFWTPVRRSLDRLEPFSRKYGVRIAIENGSFALIRTLLGMYGADFIGVCYDAGHGNYSTEGPGVALLDGVKDRLIAIHLHDNDGKTDQHRLPFTGTVDWPGVTRVIASSAYDGPVTIESVIQEDAGAPKDFLSQALNAARKIGEMITDASRGKV